ncbi:Catalase [Pseudomonas syringae pv. actinidiae]|uniref:Catalase n=2 Tax=Pseudomonas syringae pv. actinidiae TaxID=103796 RepID=A0A2V0Q2W7_PSESF|nr:Catalase [Pseudomonas syringae pv. actinidiae]
MGASMMIFLNQMDSSVTRSVYSQFRGRKVHAYGALGRAHKHHCCALPSLQYRPDEVNRIQGPVFNEYSQDGKLSA